MSAPGSAEGKAGSENGGRLIGYAECHFCSVGKKRRSLRCIRCVGRAGERGQGVSQRIELNQTEPRPVKISGWSRSENVPGEKSYRYSLYVDFGFADGESWPMKLAMFDTGTHGWQYCETVVTPPKPLRRLRRR